MSHGRADVTWTDAAIRATAHDAVVARMVNRDVRCRHIVHGRGAGLCADCAIAAVEAGMRAVLEGEGAR